MTPRTVLVTGATGYVGGRLVPRLLADGHQVRTTTTSTDDDGPWWSDQVETVQMDILDADEVSKAVQGVDAVYYLIHGMGGDDFVENDRTAAQHVAAAVAQHEVERVVYLSGIVPPVDEGELSEHLSSRLEVEEILSGSPATVLTLRAAVLMGSGSTSFEIIRQVSERLPVQTVPDWMNSRVQPIAVVDAIEVLVAALTAQVGTGHYDVGGPDAMPYADLLDLYAEVAGLTRPQTMIPLLPTDLVGVLVSQLTDVPKPTVRALVESLHEDMVVEDERFRQMLPEGYRLLGLRESIERSLAPVDESVPVAERDPMAPLPQDPGVADDDDTRPVVSRVIDAVKNALPGS